MPDEARVSTALMNALFPAPARPNRQSLYLATEPVGGAKALSLPM
jgi:hypothetical protein